MSISGVNGAGRVSLQSTDPAATSSRTLTQPQPASTNALVEIDAATQQPVPPRFPWLSRLSAQLEPVARQRTPFTSAPLLGDNLDQAA